MSRCSTVLVASVLSAVAGLPPANAQPVDPVRENYAGLTCGFASAPDPTGSTSVAEVDGGPWAVVGASSVTITCTISFGDSIVGNQTDCHEASLSQTTPGAVGAVVGTLSYCLDFIGQAVYLCAQVNWTYDETTILGVGVVTPGSASWADGDPVCDRSL